MRMLKSGLGYCKEQYDWMLEQMEVYRELEKNSGENLLFYVQPHFFNWNFRISTQKTGTREIVQLQ